MVTILRWERGSQSNPVGSPALGPREQSQIVHTFWFDCLALRTVHPLCSAVINHQVVPVFLLSMADPLLTGMLAAATDMEASFSFPSGGPAPSRVALRMSGGLARSGTASKVFTVVKVDCTDSRVCFGRIGVGGVAFCIQRIVL